jgi:hypothetical protein
MPKAVQVVQQAAAQVEELLVVAPDRLAGECPARVDQCRVPAKGHPCRDNPRPGKGAPSASPVALHLDKACLGRKARQEIQAEHKGPARPCRHRGWAPAPHRDQAPQGRRPDRGAIDSSLSYR